ncbi:NAD(P)-binding protein [Basidiobolus meristosporus CBS 931.73]|uniref:NAD(P)-binding protein n=1 Tax=Basidiobolus meristosporus CBS 931.73 TaxID=1314790 RepID=A0A1Y1WNZ0_9FUNG|nr:NAD(P)-binding protein [Basidiobolus meristosporus CBS 931.73]|eukprot:ORX75243.1 NAD(P)-binding protein [Basidiobolus meristosporus CBS 931.73]
MAPTKVFITGATGYIGGTVLTDLLKSPEKYTISALVRKKEQGEKLEELGVTPIYGSLQDLDVLFEASKAADAVINTANADDLPSIQAIVKGLKAKNNKKAVLVHTSGTGVLTWDHDNMEPYDDEDMARIHSIPLRALHKEIDAWIYDNVDDITAAIIAPSTINGVGTGPFKKSSQQVINLAKASVKRGEVGYVGKRKDVIWGDVNINDLGDLYILVLDGLLAGKIESGKEGGWYFCTNSEHTWYKISEILASVLHNLGLVKNTDITEFEQEYLDEFLGGKYSTFAYGSNSRAVANRSRKIGWKPHGPNAYETLEEEIKYIIESGEIHSKSNV